MATTFSAILSFRQTSNARSAGVRGRARRAARRPTPRALASSEPSVVPWSVVYPLLPMFKAHVDEEQLKAIWAAWQTGTPLGNDRFRAEVEAMLGRKVGQARRGRPQKDAEKSEGKKSKGL